MGTLYLVATPIGNLEDVTMRAVRILAEVGLIACEDTRIAKRLLDRYQIGTSLISCHQHSPPQRMREIVHFLKEGNDVALVTDAGTPGISDPGRALVAVAVEEGIRIVPVPGPSAATAALSVSGFSADSFLFLGFLPRRKGRKRAMEQIDASAHTVVLFESKFRIRKTLDEIAHLDSFVGRSRKVVVCRELTKRFETVYRGTIPDVLAALEAGSGKGEYVIVIEGNRIKDNAV